MDFDLTELESEKYHYLTIAAGLDYAHAASVCLDSQGHPLKANISDDGHYKGDHSILRFDVNDTMKRTWGDEEVTTENGAYAISFLVASHHLKVKVIEKSRKGSGIDYWLGEKDGILFQNKIRLEVSGIRRGDEKDVALRFNKKFEQSKKSDKTLLPALVVIVEFSRPRIRTGLRNIL
jgi:hypothetical protein